MVEFMCCTGQRYTNSAADKTGHPVDLANYVRESDSRCEQEQKKGLIACCGTVVIRGNRLRRLKGSTVGLMD